KAPPATSDASARPQGAAPPPRKRVNRLVGWRKSTESCRRGGKQVSKQVQILKGGMMKLLFRAAGPLALCLCGAAADAKDVSPQSFIAAPMRATPGSVAVRVQVAQAEIKSD